MWAIAALSFVLMGAALALIAGRAFELALIAPLDAPSFARALGDAVAGDELARAHALCDALRPGWAALLAVRALRALDLGEDVALCLEEARAEFEARAVRHLFAIATLGRMAMPLGLCVAIVELGVAFDPHPIAARVQVALDGALCAVLCGAVTAGLCQLGGARLRDQARDRLRELRSVSDALRAAESTLRTRRLDP